MRIVLSNAESESMIDTNKYDLSNLNFLQIKLHDFKYHLSSDQAVLNSCFISHKKIVSSRQIML